LQQKREQRRQRESDIADQEIAFLKASGKVSTKPSNTRRRPAAKSLNRAAKPNNSRVEENSTVNTDPVSVWRITKPRYLLPHLNPDWFYLYGSGLPRFTWKRGR